MLTVADIRTYTKDIAELNILLEGEEQSSTPLVELAMRMAVADYNAYQPFTGYTVENFPADSILLSGTLHHLANSEAERQLRNQVNFSAQGMQSSVDDKFQSYNTLAQFYKALFERKTKELKQAINVNSAWGESHSPYIGINEHNFRS